MTDIQIETDPVEPQAKIRAALVRAWAKFPSVVKDRDNKITHSRYATLDSVIETLKPALAEFELMPSQEITNTPTSVTVKTTLYHSSGESIAFSPVTLPVVGKRISGGGGEYSSNNGPQEFGSSITYARRYSLLAALGISTGDDDDGNASQPQNQHKSAHTRKAPPKKGSTLKQDIKAKKPETIGKEGAAKLEEYAASKGVSIDSIREYLATQGANHASECDKPVDKWPAEWRGTINAYLKEYEKQEASS